jgi:c-di-GMP-related signal transduction protein
MSSKEPLNRFLARQPILTGEKKLFGYEILSRYDPEKHCRQTEAKQFHTNGVDELFLRDLKVMAEGMPAFLNCTREFRSMTICSCCHKKWWWKKY